ncbi:hypothetical protein F7725_024394 [Dissostichus mawsoni]|uniref:Uncharacterized protein n=1 Tax=Dissostichus mawsoni TaxID=36200 RepID=A0A7J5Y073_DISMA|nr:hypothetical protein F7725_024394 [Dissostichus mawsoni]
MALLFPASALRSLRTSSSLPHFSSSSSLILEISSAGLSALLDTCAPFSILLVEVVKGKKSGGFRKHQTKPDRDNSDPTYFPPTHPFFLRPWIYIVFSWAEPRPCCGSGLRSGLCGCCCSLPAVRASVRTLLRLWLCPRSAWRGGFSPGACRPPLRTPAAQCALPLPDRWGGGGEGEEEEDCKGRLQVYIQDEKRVERMQLLPSLLILVPLCGGQEWEAPEYCRGSPCPQFTVVNKTTDFEERVYVATAWITTKIPNPTAYDLIAASARLKSVAGHFDAWPVLINVTNGKEYSLSWVFRGTPSIDQGKLNAKELCKSLRKAGKTFCTERYAGAAYESYFALTHHNEVWVDKTQ